jgi:hypothetical protein
MSIRESRESESKKTMSENTLSERRRAFLRTTLTAGTGLAAAVVATKGLAASVATETGLSQEGTVPAKKGYHVTQHIRDYYKTASS